MSPMRLIWRLKKLVWDIVRGPAVVNVDVEYQSYLAEKKAEQEWAGEGRRGIGDCCPSEIPILSLYRLLNF